MSGVGVVRETSLGAVMQTAAFSARADVFAGVDGTTLAEIEQRGVELGGVLQETTGAVQPSRRRPRAPRRPGSCRSRLTAADGVLCSRGTLLG